MKPPMPAPCAGIGDTRSLPPAAQAMAGGGGVSVLRRLSYLCYPGSAKGGKDRSAR
jgi:hypothetical protein